MALVTLDPDPRIIGYAADGAPIWRSAGGRGNLGIGGIEILADDGDDDEPDGFDEDDDEDDDDDDREEYDIEDRDEDDEPDDDEDEQPRKRRRKDGPQDGQEDWEPPSQAEWDRVTKALKRNNADQRRNRGAREVLKRLGVRDEGEFTDWLLDRGIDPDTGRPLDGGNGGGGGGNGADFLAGQGDGERDDLAGTDGPRDRQTIIAERRRAELRGAEREQQRWRPALVQFAAADAFRDAGFSGTSLNRVLGLLDADQVEVEFDDHGDPIVYGLDDQVKQIKEDLPELFRPRRPQRDAADEEGRPTRRRENGRRVGGAAAGARAIDGGDRSKPPVKKLGWLEMTDRAMRGLPAQPSRGSRR